jgi:hypothetical protein
MLAKDITASALPFSHFMPEPINSPKTGRKISDFKMYLSPEPIIGLSDGPFAKRMKDVD